MRLVRPVLHFGGLVGLLSPALGCGDSARPSDGAASSDSAGVGGVWRSNGVSSGGSGASASGDAGSGGVHVGGSTATAGGEAGRGGATVAGGSGGAGTGGAIAAAGATAAGGAGSGGSSSAASALAAAWPCDGPTDGYDYVVDGAGEAFTVNGAASTSLLDAIGTALGGGGASPGEKRTVLVRASGDISGAAQLRIRSNTVLNACGTIHVTDDVSGSDRSPAYARGASDIDIPHFKLTGNAQYGMFFRDVSNLHLGDITIVGTGGLGIRIDSRQSDGSFNQASSRNVTLDAVHVENTGGHGVELYGVDGIEIGTVVARNTGDSGLLLNYSINATIDLVDAVDAAGGTGYAAFRTANGNGRYPDGSYPVNIRLRELRASGSDSGRGFFCVSGSGGLEIENFTIDDVSGAPAIFIENCYNVTLASASGSGTLIGGEAHIGHNSGNGDPSRDVTLQNIALQGGALVTSDAATCGNDNQAINVTGGSVQVCN